MDKIRKLIINKDNVERLLAAVALLGTGGTIAQCTVSLNKELNNNRHYWGYAEVSYKNETFQLGTLYQLKRGDESHICHLEQGGMELKPGIGLTPSGNIGLGLFPKQKQYVYRDIDTSDIITMPRHDGYEVINLMQYFPYTEERGNNLKVSEEEFTNVIHSLEEKENQDMNLK